MLINDIEFDVLVELEAGRTVTNTDVVASLVAKGLVNLDASVNEAGLAFLEPFRVKKAIFFAAGFGSRLVPLTLEKPKPLIRVHGKRIIEGSLDAIVALGIDDITIVRGYKKELMDELLEDYPMIKFIDNDDYSVANNISSADFVKSDLAGAYVLESDLVLYNPEILKKYARHSHYFGFPVEQTDDWRFDVVDGVIKGLGVAGTDTHQMIGISYWNPEDAIKMERDIEAFYALDANKNRFWDEVALVDFKENYEVYLQCVDASDIIEIDTYDELKAIDGSYQ